MILMGQLSIGGMIVKLRNFSLLLGIPSNSPILHLCDLLDEWVHVITSCVVEQQRDEEAAALPLEVAGVISCTKELACGVVMVSHLSLC